ncbi:MAG: DUF47 domain-containing protein [Armatimonadetes bacterium]|nr:DUF47 domain-containing protein [Armatimonadota bacterium]
MIRLLPREEKFFDLFGDSSECVQEAARKLLAMLEDYADIERKASAILEVKRENNRIARDISDMLNKTFVTPLEREDIYALAHALDDVGSAIEEAADRMVLYKISGPTVQSLDMARSLVQATDQIRTAVASLSDVRDLKKVMEPCQAVHEWETAGDRACREGLAILFSQESSAIEVLKWREIYDYLENALDRCEDLADIIEDIVVKST